MVAKTDQLGAAAFIKYEQGGDLSRETLTIVSGSGKLSAGTVLGQITVGGKYKPYDNNNSDGSETAKAILVYDVDATSADAAAVCIVRLAEVWKSRLVWAATVLDAEKAPAYTELATSMVIAR